MPRTVQTLCERRDGNEVWMQRLSGFLLLVAVVGLLCSCKELDQLVQRPVPASAPSTARVQTSATPSLPPDPKLAALAKGPFAGITIIDASPLIGAPPHGGGYIVVYLSPEGSYVSGPRVLFEGLPESHGGCIAWLTEGQQDGATLTFGMADSLQKRQHALPRQICNLFTIQYEDSETVRFLQGKLNRKLKIAARVPLAIPNWSLEPFDRHAVKGVRLGPVELGTATGQSSSSSFNANSLEGGYLKQFRKPVDSLNTVGGFAAAREVTGWPSDVLVLMGAGMRLSQASSGEAFAQAVREKHGPPSFVINGLGYWIYDLQGRLLHEQDASPANCLETFDVWKDKLIGGFTTDLEVGPWGCSLVMKQPTGAGQAVVSNYLVEAAAGFAWSHGYFKTRLIEAKRYQEVIAANQPVKPRL